MSTPRPPRRPSVPCASSRSRVFGALSAVAVRAAVLAVATQTFAACGSPAPTAPSPDPVHELLVKQTALFRLMDDDKYSKHYEEWLDRAAELQAEIETRFEAAFPPALRAEMEALDPKSPAPEPEIEARHLARLLDIQARIDAEADPGRRAELKASLQAEIAAHQPKVDPRRRAEFQATWDKIDPGLLDQMKASALGGAEVRARKEEFEARHARVGPGRQAEIDADLQAAIDARRKAAR